MRYSSQRDTVLKVVKAARDHPTADTIYSRVRAELPKMSLLSDMGLITTLETLDKSIHYDGNTDSHSHFICERCSKIIDLGVERGLPEDISELGLLVRHKKIIYYGLCPDCQQNTAEDDDAGVLQ